MRHKWRIAFWLVRGLYHLLRGRTEGWLWSLYLWAATGAYGEEELERMATWEGDNPEIAS